MKTAYFDCFSGISGDMCLGALIDAGVPIEKLRRELGKLSIKSYTIEAVKVNRSGFSATKADVVKRNTVNKTVARRWKDIKKIIDASSFDKDIKDNGLKIFKNLFEAEAKVHGKSFDQVHLHELGAVDCIIDIFGTLSGLKLLGVNYICSSPLNLGTGSIKSEHGILPVPAPASIELLKGVPVYSTDTGFELTTPTGAAIIKGVSSFTGPVPYMTIEKIGIGAGSRDFTDSPNILRLFIGDSEKTSSADPDISSGHSSEAVIVIETNIDDMNPQVYEYVFEKLFKAGALDVYLENLIMKKGRPGIKLTVLCEDKYKKPLIDIILRETTTLGVRFYMAGRKTLSRSIKETSTIFGKVRVKTSRLNKNIIKQTPEYEDCRTIAEKRNIPLYNFINRIKSDTD